MSTKIDTIAKKIKRLENKKITLMEIYNEEHS